jgi:acetylornithine deacetylase/succinyl-diaminopimelate desuccinylase-like protein
MKSLLLILSLSVLVAAPALARPAAKQPLLKALAAQVSAKREQATDARLVAFGTRHTLSDTESETRGIGAARRWVAAQFEALSKDCGGCLQVETPSQTLTGARLPGPTAIVDVLAVQRGTTDPDRVVIISAHIDSRVSDVMDATTDAPGANDDGSGVSAVLEAARLLSAHRFPATIVYAVLSGEEQNLYGGKVLADYAVAQGWRVEADLNNDIIGNIHGQSGVVDNTHVRVFSEGGRATETAAQAAARRSAGGEQDSPSRNLARFLQTLADQYIGDLKVRMIYRPDRFGRAGDQAAMLDQGFPAIRITEAAENYTRQHQNVRVENGVRYGDVIEGVDFPYLAKVTRLNVIALAALASAPAPPRDLVVSGAVTPDTTLKWTPSPGAVGYRVRWRETTDPQWRHGRPLGAVAEATLKGVTIDDWFFGVSAIGADGFESPVVFPGASGSFERLSPAGR